MTTKQRQQNQQEAQLMLTRFLVRSPLTGMTIGYRRANQNGHVGREMVFLVVSQPDNRIVCVDNLVARILDLRRTKQGAILTRSYNIQDIHHHLQEKLDIKFDLHTI